MTRSRLPLYPYPVAWRTFRIPPLSSEAAQGLLEYAIILVLVAVLVIAILTVFGGQVANLFSQVISGIP